MRSRLGLLLLLTSVFLANGCSNKEYNGHGIIYGCDGSGAGVVLRWGPSASRGMRQAGYEGIIQPFHWQTGMGAMVDHTSPVAYKRSVAQKLANDIKAHRVTYPDDPVYVGGLSAGCSVVIFALEELPENTRVDQVVLLSSSVSARYDLTRALRHVHGKLYAFTSSRDAMLASLVAEVGTADRELAGGEISGLIGFKLPAGAGEATREAYAAKVREIAWRPEFANYGNHGRHTDVVATEFVAKFVAPLVVPAGRSG